MGLSGLLPNVVENHALQFCNSFPFGKEIHSGIHVVWLASCWIIWKERNNRVFAHKGVSVKVLLNKVKTTCWWWLKSRKKSFSYDLNVWWFNPLFCLGVSFG
jgi:hypothetical protein